MNEYTKKMILSYFSKPRGYYSIQELAKILGLPILVVDEYIDVLIKKGNLLYEDNLLILSNNLKESDQYHLSLIENNNNIIELVNIEPKSAWPLDRPYYPKKFTKKIR